MGTPILQSTPSTQRSDSSGFFQYHGIWAPGVRAFSQPLLQSLDYFSGLYAAYAHAGGLDAENRI